MEVLEHPLSPRRVLAGSWTRLAQLLGGSCPVFGAPWAALGPTWAPTWAVLGGIRPLIWWPKSPQIVQNLMTRSISTWNPIFSLIFHPFLFPACTPRTYVKSSGLAFSLLLAPKIDIVS